MSGKVEVKGGGKSARKGVVVYLEGKGPKKKRPNATIRQENQKFHEKLTVIVAGTTVDFPNKDKVPHNVFSNTRGAVFDLKEYKSGKSKSYQFKHAVEADIQCNIHKKMEAKVKVVPNDHYTETDSSGKFTLSGVPAGKYKIVTWLPDQVEKTKTVTVQAGKTEKVSLEIWVGQAPSKRRKKRRKKDGTAYGRGY